MKKDFEITPAIKGDRPYGDFDLTVAPPNPKQVAKLNQRDGNISSSLLSVENFEHYMSVATQLSKSSLVPKGMMGKPADILLAMEMGLQLGIPMTQAIQDIAVINGKPTMYGDGLLAAVQGHRDYEYIRETSDDKSATCVLKRRGHDECSVTFTQEDAKKAGLWGKPGPWSQYPKRMMQMRARGFCIRDTFADALRGIKTEDEVSDYQVIDARPKGHELLGSLKIKMATESQIEIMKELVVSSGMSQERLEKAKMHFGVNAFNDLTEGQANEFISILQRSAERNESAE